MPIGSDHGNERNKQTDIWIYDKYSLRLSVFAYCALMRNQEIIICIIA